ncbi:MAG: response regulator [Acidobacteriota bacterium]
MPEGQKKILVLDDEPDVVTYLATLFEDHGYEVRSAGDGRQGLELARLWKPDLITLDITMPEHSGIRFYRNVREEEGLARIPVVIVTAVTGYGGDPRSFEKFISSRRQVPPPDAFVAKPIEPDQLLQVVNELLGSPHGVIDPCQ